ncbi:MAG: CelD/BcsL family acetyltransferase involved in cellulose biosynthesis [Sphingomonadales bacterium]|nr:CelD/BcsL family acetyltransferase involved in cellulose biosynthesis [Sphingomonadales bacterium]
MSYVDHPRADAISVGTVALGAVPTAWDGAWDDLAARAAEPAPFMERWFLRPSIAHLSPNAGTRMLSVWRGPVLIGMMPVCIAPEYGRIAIRHVQNWLHYHAFLGTPLVRAGNERAFWAAVLDELDRADWAPSFLHLDGLVADGPLLAALNKERRADVVHRTERAFLKSDLSPQAYYETHIRKKKRKEIARLQSRLGELGTIDFERIAPDGPVAEWIADFLAIEASGWKGRGGTALRDDPATARFFGEAIKGASVAGRLEMLRLVLDGKPIAMLVNFISTPGSFSYKIAFDENYARYSPGVLIQLENLKILDRSDIVWMDSCAVEDHSMINSIWAERRVIVRVTVPLKGSRRMLAFRVCRALETASAFVRKLK